MAGPSEQLSDRVLWLVGIQAALLSAAAHLLWLLSSSAGVSDIRVPLFSAAIVVLVAGSAALFRGYSHRRLYSLLIGTLAALLVGFIMWEGTATVAALAAEPLAAIAWVGEIVGIVAFGVLYRRSHPDRAADNGPS
ncbi:hypothetical protein [Halalkalirubrum salinum]|uniref:hypothetical protein n=1 Tax=Halalkalirubrum salinum TaxID=2563889 RepID=UPI0010FB35E4|nr:hypothetical protein [Halalkalirubrum salinum]